MQSVHARGLAKTASSARVLLYQHARAQAAELACIAHQMWRIAIACVQRSVGQRAVLAGDTQKTLQPKNPFQGLAAVAERVLAAAAQRALADAQRLGQLGKPHRPADSQLIEQPCHLLILRCGVLLAERVQGMQWIGAIFQAMLPGAALHAP